MSSTKHTLYLAIDSPELNYCSSTLTVKTVVNISGDASSSEAGDFCDKYFFTNTEIRKFSTPVSKVLYLWYMGNIHSE